MKYKGIVPWKSALYMYDYNTVQSIARVTSHSDNQN